MSRIVIDATLPGLNEYTSANRTNARVGAQMKKQTENMIGWFIAQQRPARVESPVFLQFDWYEANAKRDCDNVAFAKKFVLDALTTAGVIAGDSPKHVAGFRDEFYIDRERPRVEVTIERIET